MSRAASGGGRVGAADQQRRAAPRYRGVRRRAWGKWVSEIRVPGTRERLWLGSYAAPEAAAVAHDAAACLLRGHHRILLNFPDRAACYAAHYGHVHATPLSPRSVQRVASDAGMAADAQLVDARAAVAITPPSPVQAGARVGIAGVARGGGEGVAAQGAASSYAAPPYAPPPQPCSSESCSGSTYRWSTTPSAGGSRSSSAGSDHDKHLVYGDISVDDIEILI